MSDQTYPVKAQPRVRPVLTLVPATMPPIDHVEIVGHPWRVVAVALFMAAFYGIAGVTIAGVVAAVMYAAG